VVVSPLNCAGLRATLSAILIATTAAAPGCIARQPAPAGGGAEVVHAAPEND